MLLYPVRPEQRVETDEHRFGPDAQMNLAAGGLFDDDADIGAKYLGGFVERDHLGFRVAAAAPGSVKQRTGGDGFDAIDFNEDFSFFSHFGPLLIYA